MKLPVAALSAMHSLQHRDTPAHDSANGVNAMVPTMPPPVIRPLVNPPIAQAVYVPLPRADKDPRDQVLGLDKEFRDQLRQAYKNLSSSDQAAVRKAISEIFARRGLNEQSPSDLHGDAYVSLAGKKENDDDDDEEDWHWLAEVGSEDRRLLLDHYGDHPSPPDREDRRHDLSLDEKFRAQLQKTHPDLDLDDEAAVKAVLSGGSAAVGRSPELEAEHPPVVNVPIEEYAQRSTGKNPRSMMG